MICVFVFTTITDISSRDDWLAKQELRKIPKSHPGWAGSSAIVRHGTCRALSRVAFHHALRRARCTRDTRCLPLLYGGPFDALDHIELRSNGHVELRTSVSYSPV